jgi:competence protein ComEC
MPPLVLIAAAWVAGLIVAQCWLVPAGVEPLSLALLCSLPLAALLLWPRDRSTRLSSSCALALLVAALRYQAVLPDLTDPGLVAHYNDQGWLTIEGVVGDYPDVRDTWTNLKLEAESVAIQGQARPVHGTVLVRAPRWPEYKYGDRLRVTGLLETPPELEGFSYRAYLERKRVYSWIARPQIDQLASGQGSPFWTALFVAKDRTRDAIARLVPEPEASLLQGILLGVRSGIPVGLYDEFNATGTSHIIVISGTNITLVAVLFSQAFGWMLGKRRAYWFTLAGIVLYVMLVGADAAVVRAGIMGGLLVTALYLGRRATAYVSLCASAIVLTAISPLALWDASFQLSFAATLSLILFTPPLERFFEKGLQHTRLQERARQALRYPENLLIATLAAQILTLPLVVYLFGRLSLVAPLANLLTLPVQPLVMSWGGAVALTTLMPWLPAMDPVVRAIAWVPWLCLAYTTAVVRWMAAWPLASIPVSQASAGWFVLSYGLILGAAWAWYRGRETARRAWEWMNQRWSTAVLLGVPLAAGVLAWLAVLQLPDGRLHVAFLDVGQGDAILITTPQGQQILVDGGPSPAALTSALGHEMPFWDRSLDLVVMTHPDADHITGLAEVLHRFRVDGWLDNGQPGDDPISLQCQALLAEAGTNHYVAHAGDRLDLGEGLALEVLHPPPEGVPTTAADGNNNSLVLRLVWDRAGFLLTGDLEAEGERVLVGSGQTLAADVLKVAHHGSGGSSTAAFLAAVDPAYAVVSVGAGNPFGHPAQAVLDRLAGLGGATVLRTDERGTVEFVTDGQRLWIRTER